MIMSFLPKSKHKFRATDINAGWSSPVARQAHNLKVAGSNPAPATNITNFQKTMASNWLHFLLPQNISIQTYSVKILVDVLFDFVASRVIKLFR